MPENTKSECSETEAKMALIQTRDREAAHELRVLLEKIEALKNPYKKLFALRLFSDIMDILAR